MKIYSDILPADFPGPYAAGFLTEEMLLLDIETTGLSPANHFIYCIGCSYQKGGRPAVDLLFAETEADEPMILRALSDLLASRSAVVTFNGNTFDLPFLQKRYALYRLKDPLADVKAIDLYREIRPLKKLLHLDSCRQKSIEQFLGCSREDAFNGGELIAVYFRYLRQPDSGLLRLLLTHNYEDVKGMYGLVEVLSYRHFLEGGFHIREIGFESDGEQTFLNLFFVPAYPLPQDTFLFTDEAKLLIRQTSALLRLPVHTGKLRYYFPDYQNYYYLPQEHMAVHKSVGAFVDAAHREKATRKNCFSEKDCTYLVLDVPAKGGCLKKDEKDRRSYLEIDPPADKKAVVAEEHFPDFYDFVLPFLRSLC